MDYTSGFVPRQEESVTEQIRCHIGFSGTIRGGGGWAPPQVYEWGGPSPPGTYAIVQSGLRMQVHCVGGHTLVDALFVAVLITLSLWKIFFIACVLYGRMVNPLVGTTRPRGPCFACEAPKWGGYGHVLPLCLQLVLIGHVTIGPLAVVQSSTGKKCLAVILKCLLHY